ncbi:MAG: cytochrome P450 [Gammaproteobacteria bacterium]
MSTERPTIDLDHHSPAFAADPKGSLDAARAVCPIAWTGAHGGFWAVTGYAPLAKIANDDATFASSRRPDSGDATVMIPPLPMRHQYPIELDPPEFFEFRRLINPLTSPAAVERMKPAFARWTGFFIDRFIERGACDLVTEFASPVPAAFTIEWLGMNSDDWGEYAEIMHDAVSQPPGAPRSQAAFAREGWVFDQIRAAIADKRAHPREDAISHLCRQQVMGRPLTDYELECTIYLLIIGGVDTTTSLTGQTLLHLYRHPEVRERLRTNRSLLDNATEEFLRVFCPVTGLGRRVTRETEVDGQHMHAGEKVWLSWLAANHDPAVFERPYQVDIDRFPNRHASFGFGAHRCAGSTVARALFKEMLGQVLDRLPDYHVDVAAVETYPAKGVNQGVVNLPVTFTPGPRQKR